MSEEALSRGVQAALDRCVACGSPGAILAIDAPALGVELARASGSFARRSERRLRAEDPFRAASVTKAVTAAAAVRLAARGRWRLDDPIAPYLPPETAGMLRRFEGLANPEALTIRMLLCHRSGLPDYFSDAAFGARVLAEPDRTWRPDELVEAAAARPLEFPPGSGFSYGDTGYVLAGIGIERLLGASLADAYRSLVLAPLAMDATYLEWHEPPRGSEVSHHYDGDRDLLPTNTSYDWAGGGLVTTARDLVRLLRGIFGGALFEERRRSGRAAGRGARAAPERGLTSSMIRRSKGRSTRRGGA